MASTKKSPKKSKLKSSSAKKSSAKRSSTRKAIADDSVWVLGIDMTRFGRYPDDDAIDLASAAAMNALADGKVTIHDMDVLAAGSLFQASSGPAQRIQKQIGQTGIPAYNVANACATGATAIRTVYLTIKAGEADMGLHRHG